MKKKFFKSFLIALASFAVVYGGIGYYVMNGNNDSPVVQGDELDVEYDDDEILFLLMGVDAKDLSNTKGQRSDTMMVCKVNIEDGGIIILSIPRDTRVDIRGRENPEKIAHAHAYGGPELAVKTVKDLLGIDLEYYVDINYKFVEEVVDKIGGVEVDVPIRMYYKDPAADPPLVIDLQPGVQVLDGDKAMQFLRNRKGYQGEDFGRIKAQQQFMKAFIDQVMKPKNIAKLPKLINSYYEYVDTNIPINLVMKYAMSLKKLDTANIYTETLPGTPEWINGVAYVIYDEQEVREVAHRMFGDYVLSKY